MPRRLPDRRLASRLFAAACGAATLAGASPSLAQAAAAADAAFRATTLNLSATGEVRVKPDLATLNLGVTTQAPTARAASQANAAAMTRVVQALRTAGLGDRDLQTSRLALSPQYADAPGGGQRVTGYQAQNGVEVTVRDLGRLSQVVDAATASGATDVGAIAFGLTAPDAAEDAARRDAVRKLTAHAELYAAAEGLKVVRLVNLSETGGYAPEPPRPMMAYARKAEATPVETGEVAVQVQASAVYELVK